MVERSESGHVAAVWSDLLQGRCMNEEFQEYIRLIPRQKRQDLDQFLHRNNKPI